MMNKAESLFFPYKQGYCSFLLKHFLNKLPVSPKGSKQHVFRSRTPSYLYSTLFPHGLSSPFESFGVPDPQLLQLEKKKSQGLLEMESGKTLEELPPGWKEYVKIKNGRKIKIYTDPSSGSKFYSKPQIMRYLQEMENKNAGVKQQLQISEGTPLKHQDMSQSEEGKINLSGENKNVMVVDENNGLDELPPGHTKEIKTRKRVHGKQDTSQASESLEGKNHIPGEKENDMDKPSQKIDYSDVQQKNGLDELPPGWIKESKARRCGSAMRKDPYYIETASGYAFRSKKDVRRYLDTGDINSCAIKPQKWDTSELKLIKEGTHHSTPDDGNKSGESATRRPLFVGQKPEDGKECSQTSTIAVSEAENSKEKEDDCVAAAEAEMSKDNSVPAFASKLTASTIEETHLGFGNIECDKSGESSGIKAEGSKQDVKIVHDNMAVNGTDYIDGLHEQKPTENCSDTKTKTDLRKSKKRKPPSTPGRSSKRLAGHEPEMLPNFSLTERALRAAIRKPHAVEANRALSKAMNTEANAVLSQHPVAQAETTMSSGLALNTAADQVPQQPVTEAETTTLSNLATNTAANEMSEQPVTEAETAVAHHTSVTAEAALETGLRTNFNMPLENQVLQQTTDQLSERQVEENPMTQGDYWSDPCWDFAFKTLTGAIPLDETLTLPSCFPQQTGTSYPQENLPFGLSEFEIPPIFQNDIAQTGPVQNIAPADQSSTNPTSAPPGNITLPSCSSQPPSLEAQSKDYQTKVKS